MADNGAIAHKYEKEFDQHAERKGCGDLKISEVSNWNQKSNQKMKEGADICIKERLSLGTQQ